ncbi:MAG: UvrB/UvrC motif-containing protein, partial [Chitinophagaceae bacterium]|nr:UvrB/UvrC motif-containing protein [Chitinophagaceae bacterium]
EELQSLLEDVLAKEDYESAGRIRDMIRRRQGGH